MASKRMLLRLLVVFIFLWSTMVVVFIVTLSVHLSSETGTAQDGSPAESKEKSRWGKYNVVSVATDNEVCSQIGRDILVYGGGSVVDAAIGSMICLGLVNPQHSGIGGGFNAVIYDRAKNETEKVFDSINARETAPPSVDPTYFDKNPSAATKGALAILVPGELNGYYEAWKKYGRIPWNDLFEPTIRLARAGWSVTESMAKSIKAFLSDIRKDPGLSNMLLKNDGSPYSAGEKMTNLKMADLLERVANEGPDVFYSGSIAADIVLDLQDLGAANITIDDLRSNRAAFSRPLVTRLPGTGSNIYTPPPPSSGVLTAFVLKIIDGYNYSPSDLQTKDSVVLFYHRLIEAWKIAFWQSDDIGDSVGFNSSHDAEAWALRFLNDTNVARWRHLIKDDTILNTGLISGLEKSNDSSTSGVCIMAADGSAVSATTTVGGTWGCKRRGLRTGIVFNDGMSLFNVPQSTNNSINYVEPLKHGRSSTSPLMVVDPQKNQIQMMLSAAGSQRIVTSISFILSQILWRGLKPQEATDEARVHHQGLPDKVVYDEDIDEKILEGLRKKGYSVQPWSNTTYPYLGCVQSIQVRRCRNCSGRLEMIAVSDYRKGKESAPSGF